jgi:pantoate--beta-alanine ligase
MQVLTTPHAARAFAGEHRRAGRTVALVPTMGALHRGHLQLVTEAGRRSDVVIVSIFVNPLQFDRDADLHAYPRPIDDDLDACRVAGVDAVYAPTAAVMYPAGFQTHVEPGVLAAGLEGTHRPGHFRGVTTVVTKLFAAAQPDVAVFGRKDLQQLAVIRQMTLDLDLGIEIVGVDTVREPDGLALSSRNQRLTADQRVAAVCLWHAVGEARAAVASGPRSVDHVERVAAGVITAEPSARLEYATIVDERSLLPAAAIDEHSVLTMAVWFGDVRLIDNATVAPPAPTVAEDP